MTPKKGWGDVSATEQHFVRYRPKGRYCWLCNMWAGPAHFVGKQHQTAIELSAAISRKRGGLPRNVSAQDTGSPAHVPFNQALAKPIVGLWTGVEETEGNAYIQNVTAVKFYQGNCLVELRSL